MNISPHERQTIIRRFTRAIVAKRIDTVRAIVNAHRWLVYAEMEDEGWTALGLAVTTNDAHIVRTLLNSGAAVDLKFPGGETPLILAAKYASEDIVSMLLTRGANVNRRSARRLTALGEAKHMGRSRIVDILRLYNLTNSGYKNVPRDLPKPRHGLRLADGVLILQNGQEYIVKIHQRRIGPLQLVRSFHDHRNPNILKHQFAYTTAEGRDRTFHILRAGVGGSPFVYDRHDTPVPVQISRIVTVED
jgi:hypothetical protein